MPYKKYGETFKKIREQENISLAAFSQIGISKAAISNFERGESMMSFDKVNSALNFMGYTLEDFGNFLNNYSITDSQYLMNQIENAVLFKNKVKLKEIENSLVKENDPYTYLAVKSLNHNLDEQEREIIIEHFSFLSMWSQKDFDILFIVIDEIGSLDLIKIYKKFFKDNKTVFNSRIYKNYSAQVFCRISTTLAFRGYMKESKSIIIYIDEYKLASSMFYKDILEATKGYWIFCFKNKNEGKSKIERALDILYFLERRELANYYHERFTYLMNR